MEKYSIKIAQFCGMLLRSDFIIDLGKVEVTVFALCEICRSIVEKIYA